MNNLHAMFMLALLLAFANAPATRASDDEPRASMKEKTIRSNYEWSAFIHAQRAPNYLNYKGSTLRPITKVTVTFRQGQGATENYEEFWYHEGKVLGMHRKKNSFPQIERDQIGAFILGGEVQSDPHFAQSCVNVLARLLIDFQLRHLIPEAINVPGDAFQSVMNEMRRYGFITRETIPTDGPQYSVVLRSVPAGDEARLFLMSK